MDKKDHMLAFASIILAFFLISVFSLKMGLEESVFFLALLSLGFSSAVLIETSRGKGKKP